jgi:hypothetical protein
MILKLLGAALFAIPAAGVASLAVITEREAPTEYFTVPSKIEVSALEPASSKLMAPAKILVKTLPPAPAAPVKYRNVSSKPEAYLSGEVFPVLRPIARPEFIGVSKQATSHSYRPRIRP